MSENHHERRKIVGQSKSTVSSSAATRQKTKRLASLVNEISGLQKKSAEDVIAIGEKLRESQDLLKHGKWGPWLASNLGWDYQTAYRYIRVAKLTDRVKVSKLRNFSPSVLYLISCESLPQGALEELMKRAAKERISIKIAKKVIAEKQRTIFKAKKPKQTAPKPQITVTATPGNVAIALRNNFTSIEIHEIYQRAVVAKPMWNEPDILKAARWVFPALGENQTEGDVLDRFLIGEGWIRASNGKITAASPFPVVKTCLVHAKMFIGVVERTFHPTLKVNPKGLKISSTTENLNSILPSMNPEKFIGPREVVGNQYDLPSRFINSMRMQSSILRKNQPWPTSLHVKNNEMWWDGIEWNATTAVDAVPWSAEFELAPEVVEFIKQCSDEPIQIGLDDETVFFIWEDGSYLAAVAKFLKKPRRKTSRPRRNAKDSDK